MVLAFEVRHSLAVDCLELELDVLVVNNFAIKV